MKHFSACRRKIAFHPTLGYAMPPVQPAKVERRNLRERNRVKQVNCGFDYLRSHIPGAAKNKKMSKVETLRHAVEYIQTLQRLLGEKAGGMKAEQREEDESDKQGSQNLLPPPIASPLAIPTPSSTASSSETTTPFEAVHFQYPSPLSPKMPRSQFPDFGANSGKNVTAAEFQSYESGYDTSSFYSSSSASSASSFTPTQQVNFCYPELSHHQKQPGHHTGHPGQYDYYGAEVNSEEDELLDVIARWQDQED